MSLARFSVRNPVAVNLMMLSVIVGGLICWFTMVREFFPRIETEQVIITVPYPGATPEEIERSVTRLVEREIEDVDGIEEIAAQVFEGATLLVAKLEQGADRDRVLNDLRGEIDKVTPDLPEGAEEPEIIEARPYIPVIAVVVHGNVPEHQLHDAMLEVRDDLLDIPSLSEVIVTGMRDREIVVEIHPERLDEYDVTFEEVGRAVQALNRDVPGGQLKGSEANVRVRTMGERRTPEDISGLILLTKEDGTVVTVGDIATVKRAFEDKTEMGRFQGNRAGQLYIFKTPEQDAIEIAGDVKAYIARKGSLLGGALSLSTTTDLSRFIEGRLELMQRNAFYGLILLLIALAVFLELRVAFWVAVGLAVAFMGTFIAMAALGMSINLISLFGLIVVLGLIVDDAIVIGENIFRKQREGMALDQAAIEGANKVALPVIAAVLTTIAAFLPLAFIEGRMGAFLGVLPMVVICALLVSLFEGFLILPGHLAHEWTIFSGEGGPIRRAMGRFVAVRHTFFERILPNLLEVQLRFILRWRYAAAAIAVALLPITFGLIVGGVVPFVFLQEVDAETVTAKLEMAAGTPEDVTIATLEKIEALALSQPEVKSVFTVVGASFSDRGREQASDPAVVGQLTVEMHPGDERERKGQRTSQEVITQLREETAGLAGVRRLSFVAQQGGPAGPDLEIRVRGSDFDALQGATAEVRAIISGFAGIEEMYDNLELGKLEARMRLRDEARLLGLTTSDVAMQLRHALYGFEVQNLQIGEDEVTVRVMLPEAERTSLENLSRLRLGLPGGKGRVPLGEAATFSTERGFASIQRVDGKRTVTVFAQVDDNIANVQTITDEIKEETKDLDTRFPGVTLSFEGRRKETRESTGSLQYLFPIALLTIYAIIAVLFRSYLQPIIVMSIIPFGIIGAIAGHVVMGFPVTLLSMIGIVALAGIVVNDGLILVDMANRKRSEGMEPFEAIVAAAKGRMRAILLTSITTCVGLGPLMLETSFQAQFLIPMAISIVFGLGFATVLILALLPVFYMILEDMRNNLRWLFGGTWQRPEGTDPYLVHAATKAATEGPTPNA
jgi:HAE1 family hydrophobic/amphiphilic exporter-1